MKDITHIPKGIATEELEELFSDFGKEFSIDIPCIAKALDTIMIEYLFSFQERKIDLADHQYDTIHFVNMLRSYLLQKLANYATQKQKQGK